VELGIGDKISDAQSYQANGIQAYLIPHYDPQDAKEMRQMAQDISDLKSSVQVVRDWAQVRQGIFDGKRFTPDQFEDYLRAEARRVILEDD
jgi:hypothetical protein